MCLKNGSESTRINSKHYLQNHNAERMQTGPVHHLMQGMIFLQLLRFGSFMPTTDGEREEETENRNSPTHGCMRTQAGKKNQASLGPTTGAHIANCLEGRNGMLCSSCLSYLLYTSHNS